MRKCWSFSNKTSESRGNFEVAQSSSRKFNVMRVASGQVKMNSNNNDGTSWNSISEIKL